MAPRKLTQDPPVRLAELDLCPIPAAASAARLPLALVTDHIGQAATDPDAANMFMRIFYLLQALGQDAFALEMQAKALERHRVYRVSDPSVQAIRLLALVGPGNMQDNAPLDFVIENSDIRLDLLYLLPGQALPEVIPDHDIAIVALSEPARNLPLLESLDGLLAAWPRPVLNHPRQVLVCAREILWQRLADIPGLLVPSTVKLPRDRLGRHEFPYTIRPVGTHAGQGLERLATATGLEQYLAAHPEGEFYLSEYVDYAGSDGHFRKLRVALIDGSPYVCHLAISDHWIVHYAAAGMHLDAGKRAEEAAVMEGFEHGFASRHGVALALVAARLGLDYVILDCGETQDGRLLLFEADTGGWIHATDPVEVFPYKPRIMQKAFDAFRAMLAERMASRQE